MHDTPQPTNGRDACRIAIHTGPDLCKLRFQQMETLINDSLTDAFLPPLPDLFATLDDATLSNPYWQSEYRDLSEAEIVEHYDGLLPIAHQLQMDSTTFVSCLKVEEPIEFQQVLHFETESERWHGSTQRSLQDCDPSELFFGLVTEKHQPDMRTWHDIPLGHPRDCAERGVLSLYQNLALAIGRTSLRDMGKRSRILFGIRLRSRDCGRHLLRSHPSTIGRDG